MFRLAIAGRTRPDRTGLGLANFRVAVVTPKPPQLDQGSLHPYYRARTDILTEAVFSLAALRDLGWTLMVHELNIEFLRPARLHDEIVVETTAQRSSDFRMVFRHGVLLAGEAKPLVTADAHVVAVGADGGLLPLPTGLMDGPR